MRIISWNVNGIRATHNKGQLQNLITRYDPDMIFMQEIKATPDKLTDDLLSPTPYTAYYNPAHKPGYAGTGVWIHSRVTDVYDIEWKTSFPRDPTADEGRVAHVGCIHRLSGHVTDIFGIYFPNGGKSEDAWQGKLVFYREFAQYIDTLREMGHTVIWGGDLNCAHHEIDLARPKENDGKIGFHPLERAWLDELRSDMWYDVFREKNPTAKDIYSWWDVITRSRERNVGWRIDAWWTSADIFATAEVSYLTDHMGSDHCPILLDLTESENGLIRKKC